MKKLLLLLFITPFFTACSSDDNEGLQPKNEEQKPSVEFIKNSISLKCGESSLIEIDKDIKDCSFSIKDDFYTSISVNGDEAKLNGLKVGQTEIYVEYKGSKDTCLINVEAKTNHFGKPLLTLGTSRDDVREYMKNYQQGGSIGGYTGLKYNFGSGSEIFYQFDASDNLVAIKQILKRSSHSFDNIIVSINERFDHVSASSTVSWYKHDKFMMVRVEKSVTDIIIHYAKDATIMFEYFPW